MPDMGGKTHGYLTRTMEFSIRMVRSEIEWETRLESLATHREGEIFGILSLVENHTDLQGSNIVRSAQTSELGTRWGRMDNGPDEAQVMVDMLASRITNAATTSKERTSLL